METSLTGKTYRVTGATSGIGLAAAEQLASLGAALIGVGRSQERCRETERRLRALTAAPVDCLTADLSRQSDIRRLAAQIHTLLAGRGTLALDGLLNNAGTFTYWFTQTPDGVETQWAVNHLAPFLLTHHLLDLLAAAPAARVVTVSSDSHAGGRIRWDDPQLRRGYNGLAAYSNTKLANVLFTAELNRRLGPTSSVRAFAADPGLVKTDIGLKGTPGVAAWVWKLRRSGGVSPQHSARGIVALLTEENLPASASPYWKDGRPKAPAARAMNPIDAARLWTLSSRMCATWMEAAHVQA